MVSFNDADDFFDTMSEGGKAYRLQDIDGIGPATAEKIMSVRGINTTDDVKELSADELSDKAGISRSRASTAISGLGGNPSVSKRNNSTGSVSAAGIKTRQGDFWVDFTEMDKARARNDAQSRSQEAVRIDDQRRAPITTDYEQWRDAPGQWDYPSVDTPTQEPDLLPKDLKAGDPNTADFDAQGQAEFDDSGSEFPKKEPAASGKENFNLRTGENRTLPASLFTAEGGETPDVDDFGVFTEARDVSLSPDEAFYGTGAVGDTALGGFDNAEWRENEKGPTANLQAPPEQALQAQSRGEIADIPDIPGIDAESAPADLVEDFNSGLISMREFADQLDER